MKRHNITMIMAVVAMTLLIGCAKEPSLDDKVLVKVSNSAITLRDFNARIAKLPSYYKNIAEKNKKRYLEEMITEKLLYEEALRRGLNYDKEVTELVSDAKRKIVAAKLIKNEVDDKVRVDDNEALAFYEANRDKLTTPDMARASHILVPTREEADQILQELNSGASFEELAKQKSKDATASRGGDIGFFRTGQLVPDFESAALKLNVGQMSGVVHTRFGYHIIKLTDRKGPGTESYENAKPMIENELKNKKRADMFYELIMALKKRYGVNVDENAFESDLPAAKEGV